MNDTFVSSVALDQPEILPVSHLSEYRRGVEGFGEMIAEFRRRERENLFIVLQKTGWKSKGVA